MMPEVEVVLFTAYADIALAVEGMKRGAFDFIVKPWDNEKLVATLIAARDKARKAMGRDAKKEEDKTATMYWGSSRAMAVIQKTVDKIAPHGCHGAHYRRERYRQGCPGAGDSRPEPSQ